MAEIVDTAVPAAEAPPAPVPEPAAEPVVEKEAPAAPASSHPLVTIVRAADVDAAFKAAAQGWTVWDSMSGPDKFPFSYSEDEEVLITNGRATLTPTAGDDKAPITIDAGDRVTFHKGFKCAWVVDEPMTKFYHYPVPPPKIACDKCGLECWEESYFVEAGGLDICPKCKKTRDPADRKAWRNAERQRHGEPWDSDTEDEKPKKKAKK